jgi:hypothetical protein
MRPRALRLAPPVFLNLKLKTLLKVFQGWGVCLHGGAVEGQLSELSELSRCEVAEDKWHGHENRLTFFEILRF